MTQAAAAPAALRTLAFVSGCGRSGTTILGRLVEQHPDVCYLNDRFDLWIRPFPFTDIWGHRADGRRIGARVSLGAEDANVPQAAKSWFGGLLEAERAGRPVVVEKLAINNFRLAFLRALCPEARLINIVRHGVEVARSIEQKAGLGHWYGPGDRKWALLVEHAWANGYGPLVGLCKTSYLRGLLEWRMSVDAADAYFDRAGGGRHLRLRYEELVADPAGLCRRLCDFLDLQPSPLMEEFALKEIRRRSPAAHDGATPPGTEAVAGPALERLGYSV